MPARLGRPARLRYPAVIGQLHGFRHGCPPELSWSPVELDWRPFNVTLHVQRVRERSMRETPILLYSQNR